MRDGIAAAHHDEGPLVSIRRQGSRRQRCTRHSESELSMRHATLSLNPPMTPAMATPIDPKCIRLRREAPFCAFEVMDRSAWQKAAGLPDADEGCVCLERALHGQEWPARRSISLSVDQNCRIETKRTK